MTSVVRKLMALSLALAALFAAPAHALDTGDIVVESIKGEVRVTMNGAERPVRAGGVLELPATIDTGRDGAIELRQGATTLSVGPETRLEFPALEKRGGPIDRIVQPRGNAFYSIGKREGRRLRVETPYLVGVVKGTQFNVAAQDESTTISLFEGLLEIHASDESSVIDLKAGEIASRKRGGKAISVITMDTGKAPPTQRGPAAPGGNGDNGGGSSNSQTPGASGPSRAADPDSVLTDRGVSPSPVGSTLVETGRTVADAAGSIDAGVDVRGNDAGAGVSAGVNVNAASANVDVGAAVNVGNVAGVDLDAGISAGNGAVSVDVSAGVDAGAASVGASVTTNVSAGAIDIGANVAVDAGPLTADVGAAANVNLGAGAVDVGANVAVDAGPIAADVGAAANVDLGAGNVGTGVNAAVDAGPLTADTGAAAAVDVGAGNVAANVDLSAGAGVGNVAGVDTGAAANLNLGTTVDVSANVDVGANVAGVGAAVTAGVDVAAGSVDLGVNVAGVDLGLGLDLGLDGNKSDTSNPGTTGGTPPPPTTPIVDVGGLLDGILNRHRRK